MADMKRQSVYAVILAGGQSSRLFPFNKVISDLTGSGKSLIQQAFARAGLAPKQNRYVLTVREMVAPIRRQLKLPADHFFVDPVRRGTWPALLWAMGHLRQKNPDAIMAVMTGDHVIQGDRAFSQAFRQAVKAAGEKKAIVMMGIPPVDDPSEWRGFGCFRADASGKVIDFCEKPTLERSQQMIEEGDWQWNSGMFFFRIATAEVALERFQPEMFRVYKAVTKSLAEGKESDAASQFKDFADKIPHPLDPGRYVDNSIDYAIMTPLVATGDEGLLAAAVCGTRFRWTDLGQWTALRQVAKPDRHGNVCVGDVQVGPDVCNSILAADRGHRILVSGIQDRIVAFAGGKALVLPVSDVGRIKEIVALSKAKGPLVGDPESIASFALSKRSNVAVLSNRPKEAI